MCISQRGREELILGISVVESVLKTLTPPYWCTLMPTPVITINYPGPSWIQAGSQGLPHWSPNLLDKMKSCFLYDANARDVAWCNKNINKYIISCTALLNIIPQLLQTKTTNCAVTTISGHFIKGEKWGPMRQLGARGQVSEHKRRIFGWKVCAVWFLKLLL